MSGYRGRTGPNFSQYLNSLNTVSPPYDPVAPFAGDDGILDLNTDLSIFTNTDFTSMDDTNFNFDLATDADNNAVAYDEFVPSPAPAQSANTHSPATNGHFYPSYNTPIQPAPVPNFAQIKDASPAPSVNQTRKAVDPVVGNLNSDETSRLAAEEDKRRRNTAASARFRVKKKQREQALEKTLKEAQDKSSKLEARLHQLELENKWLKDLITEKNGMQSKEEMAAAYQKFRKESEERDVKASHEHTTGVGTD